MGGKVLLVDFMRVSMDKNEENEEIETSFMEIKTFTNQNEDISSHRPIGQRAYDVIGKITMQ